MMSRKRTIIESPFKGNTIVDEAKHLFYLKLAIRDSVFRREAPFGSHGFYPGALDDKVDKERAAGIACGYAWWQAAEQIVFYADYGYSEGMYLALLRAADVPHLDVFERRFHTPTARENLEEQPKLSATTQKVLKRAGHRLTPERCAEIAGRQFEDEQPTDQEPEETTARKAWRSFLRFMTD